MYVRVIENPRKCGICHKENVEVKPFHSTTRMEDGKNSCKFLNSYLCEECVNKLSSLQFDKVEIESVNGVTYRITINK